MVLKFTVIFLCLVPILKRFSHNFEKSFHFSTILYEKLQIRKWFFTNMISLGINPINIHLICSLLIFLSSDIVIKLILRFSSSSIRGLLLPPLPPLPPNHRSKFSGRTGCRVDGAARTSWPFNWKSGGSLAFKLGGLNSGVLGFFEWCVGVGGQTGRFTRLSFIAATYERITKK